MTGYPFNQPISLLMIGLAMRANEGHIHIHNAKELGDNRYGRVTLDNGRVVDWKK